MAENNQVAQSAQTTAVTAFNYFDDTQIASAQRAANMFASSMLVPDTYQTDKIYTDLVSKKHMDPNNPGTLAQAKMTAISNCVIALDIASRIGAAPLMVMQNLVIIYGRPSWSSKFLISTVNTCGRFEPLKFRFTEKGKLGKFNYTEYAKTWVSNPNGKGYYKNEALTKEFDGSKIADIECVAYTTAKSDKEGRNILESSPISIRMSIDEGWFTKNGSKWRTMPKQMLMYRAASFWTSVYAPELSMGMRTVEENQDIAFTEAEDVTDQVNAEKSANANKETLDIDMATDTMPEAAAPTKPTSPTKPTAPTQSTPPTDPVSAPSNVDPATGEINQGQQGDMFDDANGAGPGY